LAIPSPAERPTSATRLEGWARCPFAYLVRDVLGVQEVENPEDRLEISPLDQGTLVHSILERFVQESLDRRGSSPEAGSAGATWTGEDGVRLREIAQEECDRYQEHGLVGRPIFWQRDRRRLIADLERFLRDDASHRALHGLRPVAAELAFGLPGSLLPTVSLRLPDGRHVAFRGKADRLDVADDGAIEVLDYKTGRSDSYRDLNEDNPDARGTRLQLVVYGLAARLREGTPDARVRAEYWFTSRKGRFHRVGYEITPEVLERVSETVGRIVDGIEGGAFPNRPTVSSSSPFVECPYCDPDGLGVVDLRHRVERKSKDPALADFVELVAGGAADSPDAGKGGGSGAGGSDA
jgi:ATP-dependent helicase/nuclease subunit B